MSSKDTWERVYSNDDLPWTENSFPQEIFHKFIDLLVSGGKVLDYGCGNGIFVKELVDNGFEVTGSEISKSALRMAEQNAPKAKYILADRPQQLEGMYDAVLCWGVFHHISYEKWGQYFQGLLDLTKEGGILLIGGHSRQDEEFRGGSRISPTTNEVSHAVDSLLDEVEGLNIISEGFFPFDEAFTGARRVFKYFLIRKEG